MSEITFADQTVSLLLAAGIGAVLCLLYDVFRLLRLALSSGRVAIFIEDVLWFFLSALVTYMLCLARCKGEVRGFIIIGEVLGFLLWRISASRGIMHIMKPAIKAGKRLSHRLESKMKAVLRPIAGKAAEKIAKIKAKCKKILKKHLHRRIPLLYNRKKNKMYTE